MKRTEQIAGGLVLLIIIGGLFINPASAQTIKAPAKITVPGVYELAEDARGITDVYGISIECSNVVIDGGNYFLGGEGREKSVGVYVNQYGGSITNITVKNLLLEKWETGIDYKYVKGQEGDSNLITGCDIVDSETAIHVEYSDYVQVIENTITGCPTGITVEGLSTYTLLEKNTIKDSGLGVGVTNNKYTNIKENNINTCSVYGLEVIDSEYTTIVKNGISDNKYAAIHIENSRESEISGNTLTKTETGPVLVIGNEVRYAKIINNYFGSYEDVSVDDVSSEIVWNSTQESGTNILGGPYMGGNYWGSASGTKGFSDSAPDEDGFGISDKPYQINEYNIDYLPLTHTTATKAPEDQISTPVLESDDSSVNQTEVNATTLDSAPELISETNPSESGDIGSVNNSTNNTGMNLSLTTNEGNNSSVDFSVPVPNLTPVMTPVQIPVLMNNSIMNRSLTNSYPGVVTGDQISEPVDDTALNQSAPAQVGYLVFNISEPECQVTLTTATGVKVSLDQTTDNSITVPVPVKGLTYTRYFVECNGFMPVSGNISPYPVAGEKVIIPVNLKREGISPAPVHVAAVQQNISPDLVQTNLSSVNMSLVNPIPEVQVPANPIPIQVNRSVSPLSVNSTGAVVITNGVMSADPVRPPHYIMATSGSGGSVSPAGNVKVLDTGSVTFIIEPDDGHKIANLVIDDIQIGPMSEYRFINVTTDHTIAVGFI